MTLEQTKAEIRSQLAACEDGGRYHMPVGMMDLIVNNAYTAGEIAGKGAVLEKLSPPRTVTLDRRLSHDDQLAALVAVAMSSENVSVASN